MAWVKYGENDLINLDKTTDIHIEKVQDKKFGILSAILAKHSEK